MRPDAANFKRNVKFFEARAATPFTPSLLDPMGASGKNPSKRGEAMHQYDYKVVPAPSKGEKDRGLKTGADRFAHALELAMNALARDGWEYWRAETLPAEERSGLTSKTTVFHNLLVFRRPRDAAATQSAPETGALAAAPSAAEKRARQLSTHAPEGNAPRLGPAEDDEA